MKEVIQAYSLRWYIEVFSKTGVDIVVFAVWPNSHERIVEDIAEYGQVLLLTPDGGEDRVEILKQFKDMFEPNGMVDIAF